MRMISKGGAGRGGSPFTAGSSPSKRTAEELAEQACGSGAVAGRREAVSYLRIREKTPSTAKDIHAP